MVILKGFKTCVVIDSRGEQPTVEYKNSIDSRFLNKIVDGDLINDVEYYHNNTLIQLTSTGTEGGLTKVNSLKHLKLI